VAREKSGSPLALMPFARRRRGVLGVVEFIGGKHANFNLGLFRPGRAWSAAALSGLLSAAAAQAQARVDLYALVNQPRHWQGRVNPLAALGGWASPSFGYKSELPLAFEAWRDARYSKVARRKLRKKAERLASMGAVSHRFARDEAEAARMLEALIALRCGRARREGVFDANENPDAQAFLRQLATAGPAGKRPIMELHALTLDERAVAAFAALPGRDRLSGPVIAYDADPEIARCSPGELILHEVVRSAIARGFETFDLGVGEARYKNECCEATETLFDAFVAASPLGRLAALAYRLERRVRRIVKRSQWLSALAARLSRRSFKPPPQRPAAPASR
jgi:CelD/BcsL family acetyltransferase involved in cellulose biosynthesis